MKIGFFSNKIIFWGIASILVLQALFIYTPFMQKVFGTAPLDSRGLIIAFVAGSFIYPIIALEKWLVKKMSKNSN